MDENPYQSPQTDECAAPRRPRKKIWPPRWLPAADRFATIVFWTTIPAFVAYMFGARWITLVIIVIGLAWWLYDY